MIFKNINFTHKYVNCLKILPSITYINKNSFSASLNNWYIWFIIWTKYINYLMIVILIVALNVTYEWLLKFLILVSFRDEVKFNSTQFFYGMGAYIFNIGPLKNVWFWTIFSKTIIFKILINKIIFLHHQS
jgi:hypothetical protein